MPADVNQGSQYRPAPEGANTCGMPPTPPDAETAYGRAMRDERARYIRGTQNAYPPQEPAPAATGFDRLISATTEFNDRLAHLVGRLEGMVNRFYGSVGYSDDSTTAHAERSGTTVPYSTRYDIQHERREVLLKRLNEAADRLSEIL